MQVSSEKLAVPDSAIENEKQFCLSLAHEYHPNDAIILKAAQSFSPYQFIRLFVTAHGMKPSGNWETHTYARFRDHTTKKDHFFLIPMQNNKNKKIPWIRFENNNLKIDDKITTIYPQSIPYTNPFWYFHYDPNKEKTPFYSMTLNFSPSCLEKCVLCAGAKTGRVNNGMSTTLAAIKMTQGIFEQHPEAIKQLDSVAVVTGCFKNFDELKNHLTDVKNAVGRFCQPNQFRVLEHNIETEAQFDMVVSELGYEIFITLECFDQSIRDIALNGKVGRKGRNSLEFLTMIKNYANYLESRPLLKMNLVRVTYLVGLDSLEVMDKFFQDLAQINANLKNTTIIPWLSIFTAYNKAMDTIQNESFNLRFILEAMALAEKYFDPHLLLAESGGTREGYARGLY